MKCESSTAGKSPGSRYRDSTGSGLGLASRRASHDRHFRAGSRRSLRRPSWADRRRKQIEQTPRLVGDTAGWTAGPANTILPMSERSSVSCILAGVSYVRVRLLQDFHDSGKCSDWSLFMRSVKVRYSEVTRAAKLRVKAAEQLASTQPRTAERIEEERILAKFKERAREDYGTRKSEKLLSAEG